MCDHCACILMRRGFENPTGDQVESLALCFLHRALMALEKTLRDFNLPEPAIAVEQLKRNRLIQEELDYPIEQLRRQVEEGSATLNNDQRRAYDAIVAAYEGDTGGLFFIDGPGGIGKTYLENLLLKKVRANGHIALAVVSSDIAALLLEGGRTTHSRLAISLEPTADSVYRISKQCVLADLIRLARLILWDEAPMTHKLAFEALDRTLRDLSGNDEPFGGKVFVMAGDFHQVLPVVRKGTRADTAVASIRKSSLWTHGYVRVLCLRTNMRAGGDQVYPDLGNRTFTDWLLAVGDNRIPPMEEGSDFIPCPQSMELPRGSPLMSAVYSD